MMNQSVFDSHCGSFFMIEFVVWIVCERIEAESWPLGSTRNLVPRHSISSPRKLISQTANVRRSRIGTSQKKRASTLSFKPYTPIRETGRNRAVIVAANSHHAKVEKFQANSERSAVAVP